MKRMLFTLSACWAAATAVLAIQVGPFGPHGEGGSIHGQEFRIGPGGHVYELDALLSVGGQDLNGSAAGTSASLARHSLPPGMAYQFTSALSPDRADLDLTYVFSNTGSTPFADLRFFVLLDTEIDQEKNTFFDEYGQYGTVSGSVGQGPLDAAPDLWQIDEPGFQTGTVFSNLYVGTLSNSNAVPSSASDDVALSLGFLLGTLKPGDSATVRVKISENGNSRGSLALTQRDLAPDSPTTITLSGEVDMPPPCNVIAQLSFRWGLDLFASTFIGTLRLGNAATNSVAYGPPFHLALRASADFSLAHPAGTQGDGLPYLDLTDAVMSQLGSSGRLAPGQTVLVVDGLDVFSHGRSPPPIELFELRATCLK